AHAPASRFAEIQCSAPLRWSVPAGLAAASSRRLEHRGLHIRELPLALTVAPVRGARELGAFIELPFSLHADSAEWVPPLRLERRADRWFRARAHDPPALAPAVLPGALRGGRPRKGDGPSHVVDMVDRTRAHAAGAVQARRATRAKARHPHPEHEPPPPEARD